MEIDRLESRSRNRWRISALAWRNVAVALLLIASAVVSQAQDAHATPSDEGAVSKMLRGMAALVYKTAWPTASYDHIEFGRFLPQSTGWDVSAVLYGRSFFDGTDLHVEVVIAVRDGTISDVHFGLHNGFVEPGTTAKAAGQVLAEAARQYQASQSLPARSTSPSTVAPATAATQPSTHPADSGSFSKEIPAGPIAAVPAPDLTVPVGNMPATREALYTLGFPERKDDVITLLRAAEDNDLETFDAASARLRANKQRPVWPEDHGERANFVGRLGQTITDARNSNDWGTLQKAIALDELFLQSHFGYANAQLNLAIAQNAMGQVELAFPPAFHAIVFNPDGANGYLVLGVLLARGGDAAGSTAAFCAGLRKANYTDRTVSYYASIASGQEYPYPGVASAVSRTATACPREKWAR